MPSFYHVNLPAYNPGPQRIDFSPLSRGIQSLTEGVKENRLMAQQRDIGTALSEGGYGAAADAAFSGGDLKTGLSLTQAEEGQEDRDFNRNRLLAQDARSAASDARSREIHGLNVQKTKGDIRDRLVKNVAGVAQMIRNEADPSRKAQMVQALINSNPRMGQELSNLGLDPANPDAAMDMILAEARGVPAADKDQFAFTKYGVGNKRTGQLQPYANAAPALTPAQEAADKAYAKDYTETIAGGGFADSRKNIAQMKEVLTDLKNPEGPQLTGPFIGSTPDFVSKFTHPKAIDTRERVEEVVQRNLREILGAQFTEAEGERLISRAYNPRLSESANAERLGRLVTAMEAAYDAKVAAARHYEQYGTLSNYPGSARVTVEDLESAIEGAGQTPQQTQSQPPAPAVQFLQQNRSPEIIEQFNRKYGPGAAERILGNQPPMTGVSP